MRVAVDGGANHLRGILENNFELPNIVCGDFDSISAENLKFFENRVCSCFQKHYLKKFLNCQIMCETLILSNLKILNFKKRNVFVL